MAAAETRDGRTYDDWLEDVRGSLVRWPGEEELFELARSGYIGQDLSEGQGGWLQSIANRVLRKTRSNGQCAAVFGALQSQFMM